MSKHSDDDVTTTTTTTLSTINWEIRFATVFCFKSQIISKGIVGYLITLAYLVRITGKNFLVLINATQL